MGCCSKPGEAEMHRKFAIDCNNEAWPYLDKEKLTEEEADELVHMVHASVWHWSRIGKPINMVRGYYMLAKTYYAINKGQEAGFWAEKSWNLINSIDEKEVWDIPFCLEIMARHAAFQKNIDLYQQYKKQFHESIKPLGKDDKEIAESEWKKQPWFGA